MIKLKDRLADFEPIPTESGSPIRELFTGVTLPDGGRVLKKTGEFNQDEYIQSFKDDCDYGRLVESALLRGDPSMLNRSPGFYADISEIPSNLAEFTEILRAGYNDYLSKGGSEKFGNFENYLDGVVPSLPSSSTEEKNEVEEGGDH